MQRNIDGYRTRLQDQASAEKYATRFERGRRRGIDRREQRAVGEIFSRLTDCGSVLDVPCGAGRFHRVLGGNKRRVLEMDVALEVLVLAQDRARQAGLDGFFLAGDASRLPLLDQCVDAVFCNRLLHHITVETERARFLREFHRVARRCVVVSFFDYLAFGRLRAFFKRLKGRNVSYAGQPTLAQFRAECDRSGFTVERVVPTGPVWVSEKYLVLRRR